MKISDFKKLKVGDKVWVSNEVENWAYTKYENHIDFSEISGINIEGSVNVFNIKSQHYEQLSYLEIFLTKKEVLLFNIKKKLEYEIADLSKTKLRIIMLEKMREALEGTKS